MSTANHACGGESDHLGTAFSTKLVLSTPAGRIRITSDRSPRAPTSTTVFCGAKSWIFAHESINTSADPFEPELARIIGPHGRNQLVIRFREYADAYTGHRNVLSID